MMYKELSSVANLASADLTCIVGGLSENGKNANVQFRLDDLAANPGCKNNEKCYEQTGDHGLGHAFQGLGINPGDINQQGLTYDDVF